MTSCSSETEAPPPPVSTTAPEPRGGLSTSEAGSIGVGQARYPAPAEAVVVDGRHGGDHGDGSVSRPYRTIQAAVDRATDGQTVVIHGGVYHETVYVNRPITLQNAAGEAVWLDGSEPVTQWEQVGGVWRAPLPVVLDRSIGPDHGDPYISDQFPAAAEPEMLFRDGVQLRQVLELGDVGDGSFMADRRRQLIYTGRNPGNSEWRTASLAQALVVSAPDVTIRGIGVRGYGNSVHTQGAVYLARRGDVLENVVIEDVATTAVTFYSDANQGTGQARRLTIRRPGLMGIGGMHADGLRLNEILIEGANYERFNPTPNSAGIKITQSRDIAVEASVVRQSYGTTGIWFDESVVGFGVYGNEILDNGATGVAAELASHGRIADNVVVDHQIGVILYSSGNIDVVGNEIRENQLIDLDLRQDHRRQADASARGHDARFPPGDPTNPWLVQDIHIDCNVFGPGPAQTRLRAVDTSTGIPADAMRIFVDSTVFIAHDGTVPVRWGTGPPDQTRDILDPGTLPTTEGTQASRARLAGPTAQETLPCGPGDAR